MSELLQKARTWENASSVLALPGPLQFNPIDFPICTRLPERHNVLSAWVGHIPFAMCLIELVKPRILVELGAHYGTSYCAFCQAVKELRLPTRCFAVDTWSGDPHASFYSDDVFEDLKAHHERYALFSELIRSTFAEALPRFEDRSIDVLHIDGFHTYDAVKQDFETWLPKLSERGLVLFHDIEVRDRNTFGVWRFWDEIKQHYPHFAFYHCWGLGILAVGEEIPEGFQMLMKLGRAEADRIRSYFSNLGDHLTALHDTAMQKENLVELLKAKTEECNRALAAAAHHKQAEERLQAVADSLTWKATNTLERAKLSLNRRVRSLGKKMLLKVFGR